MELTRHDQHAGRVQAVQFGKFSGVSEIFERNYARDFCGRGYILFEYSDGETAYLYTAFSEELNCGNVAEMAYAYKNDANSDYKLISVARRAIVDAYAAKRKEA